MSERDSKRPRTDGAGGGPIENPYLAHLNEPHQRTYGGGQAAGGAAPLDGWIARKITGKMVEKAMVSFFSSSLRLLVLRCAGVEGIGEEGWMRRATGEVGRRTAVESWWTRKRWGLCWGAGVFWCCWRT